ncbi:hypothetical protein ACSBR2_034610 [Camellia fascicularis]
MDTTTGPVEPSTIPSTAVIGTLPHNGFVSTLQTSLPLCNAADSTLGRHLARCLVQIGVSYVFSVPGDFNLTFLDHLLAEPGLNLISCCNELNAGYPAGGFARSRGVGACVVTFTVGGLSVINAIAGAYSENLPVICIVGGPNSNDYGTNRILHHTIGLPEFSQELRCFQTVTCYQAVVNNLEDAHELIDNAISTALKESKPVYISVSFAVMPSAKGLVVENHPHFIGTYWGAVSTAFCAEIVESADAYLFAGPIFNDYSSVGYSLLLKREKAIIVQPEHVVIGNGPAFGCVTMKDFLRALSKRLKRNATAYDNYHRMYVPEGHPLKCEPNKPLKVNVLFHHIQKMLSSDRAVIAETGDSWFNCQKLKLPDGCATLGYAQAAQNKQVIACIGDGSFQVRYEEELIEAIDTAMGAKSDCLWFIEVIVHKDDTSKELLEWGSRVSAANSRPPNPQ